MRLQSASLNRRGTVLLYFALVVFVLLAVAALTIDLGMALATRQQLQTAADTAALEALRTRDDPSKTNQQQRQLASDLVRDVFDDKLNPADGDPFQLSAGPTVDFHGGIDTGTSFKASQKLNPAPPYKPFPPLNTMNDPSGDLVRGTYLASGSHQEGSDYTRGDFVADSSSSSTPGKAFLVRLRRTGEPPVDGVSDPGPRLPYLFGQGSLLNPELKARGIVVRATAIADARPALTAGMPRPATTPPTSGVTPFALNSDVWATLTRGVALPIDTDAAGNLKNDVNPIGFATAGPAPMPAPTALQLGQAVSQTAVSDIAGYVQFILQQFPQQFNSPSGRYGYGYVPVVGSGGAVAPALAGRVIGFGFVEVRPDSSATRFQLTIRAQSVIAPANASAVPLQLPNANVSAAVLTKALAANQTFAAAASGGGVLLAPMLVTSTGP